MEGAVKKKKKRKELRQRYRESKRVEDDMGLVFNFTAGRRQADGEKHNVS